MALFFKRCLKGHKQENVWQSAEKNGKSEFAAAVRLPPNTDLIEVETFLNDNKIHQFYWYSSGLLFFGNENDATLVSLRFI